MNGSLPILDRILCDDVQLFASFETVKNDMILIGDGASFLTEFGVCSFNKNSSPIKAKTFYETHYENKIKE